MFAARFVSDQLNSMLECIYETYWQQVFRHNGVWTTQKSIVNWIEKLDYIKIKFSKLHLNVKEKFNLNKSTQIKWKKINDTYIMIELIKQ